MESDFLQTVFVGLDAFKSFGLRATGSSCACCPKDFRLFERDFFEKDEDDRDDGFTFPEEGTLGW